MTREHLFGYGHGKVSCREFARIARIARKHEATFTNPNMPGRGHCFWFTTRNRGAPFDQQVESAVLAEVGTIKKEQ